MELRKWTVSLGLAAVVLVIALLVVSLDVSEPVVDSGVDSSPDSGVEEVVEPQERSFEVRVSAGGISPSEMVVNQGDEVVLRVRSLDGAAYTLIEPTNGLYVPVVAGETTETVFTASRTGSFELFNEDEDPDISTQIIVN